MRKIDILLILLIVLGVAILGYGFWQGRDGGGDEIEYLAAGGGSGEKVMVDVSGEVVNPGVYELTEGERIKDALVAAGGMDDEADREFVEKTINMADKVKDGQKIYIPPMGGVVNPQGVSVNVNKASLSELDGLWGVGAARAQTIIDLRPYAKLEELVSKGAMPKNVYDRNVAKMSVY